MGNRNTYSIVRTWKDYKKQQGILEIELKISDIQILKTEERETEKFLL